MTSGELASSLILSFIPSYTEWSRIKCADKQHSLACGQDMMIVYEMSGKFTTCSSSTFRKEVKPLEFLSG